MNKELEALKNIRNSSWGIGNSLKEQFKIIEEALKRNEPMKVYSLPFNNGLAKDYRCRNCGSYLVSESPTNIRLVANSIIFCKHCGQKIDWEVK